MRGWLPWIALIGWVLAALGGYDMIRANERARTAKRVFDSTTEQYQLQLSRAEVRIQNREAEVRSLKRQVASVRSRADTIRLERGPEPELRGYVPDSIYGLWQNWRSSVLGELEALREVLKLQDQQIAALEANLKDRELQLEVTEHRLGVALAGWEASERARRPTALTWATRGLAIVGTVLLAKEVAGILTP